MHEYQVSFEGANAIRKALRFKNYLKEILIFHTGIGCEAAKVNEEGLKTNTSLRMLG